MQVALDTNFLVYFFELSRGASDDAKVSEAQNMLPILGANAVIVIPVQVYGELYSVAVKFGRSREKAQESVAKLRDLFNAVGSNGDTLTNALDLATEHKLQFWDALILSTAADTGCSLLLSEDMQAGFTWRGVTIVNPFAKNMDVRLKRVMRG